MSITWRSSTSLRCQGAQHGACPEGLAAGRGRGATLRATSSAVLTTPNKEGGLERRPALAGQFGTSQSRTLDFTEPVLPASSGLDFIDLVGMEDSIVWNRLQDAVTYRVLVGQPNLIRRPTRPTHTETINVKQLKLYRDNVTRNLAPTVARGFANALRAAGRVIATTQSSQQPQPLATAEPPPPPPPMPQRPHSGATTPAPTGSPAPTSATAASAAGDSNVGYALVGEPLRLQTQRSPAQTLGVAAAVPSHSAAGCRPTRRVSLAVAGHTGEQQRIAVRCAAQARQLQLAPEERLEAADAATAAATAAAASQQQQQQQQPSGQFVAAAPPPSMVAVSTVVAAVSPSPSGSLPFEAAASDVGPAASALASGRRRGSRGAGRGALLAVAGRQAGTAGGGAGTGPAWI